jgi:hypothetical protein
MSKAGGGSRITLKDKRTVARERKAQVKAEEEMTKGQQTNYLCRGDKTFSLCASKSTAVSLRIRVPSQPSCTKN